MSTEQVRRAVTYVRLSSYKGPTDPSTSPERQEEVCDAYACSKGWQVVEVVKDLDVSGSTNGPRLRRQGLDRIRSLWGQVDVILVSKLDRLARNVSDFLAFAEEAREHGASLVSVGDNLDMTTASGEFFATLLAALAAMEANTISERARAGKAAAARLHRWTGGPPPYGYKVVPHPSGAGKGLEVNQVEAEIVRETARFVLEGGTMWAATKRLNAAGIRPRKAQTWRINSIISFLTGDQILGRLRFRGEVVRGQDGFPLQVWEPVLTLEEVQRLRAHLKPQPARPRRASGKRLLSGLARCGSCGQRMYVGTSGGRLRYTCTAGGCSRPVSVGAQLLEEYVEGRFTKSPLMFYPTWQRVEEVAEDPQFALIEEEIARVGSAVASPGADIAAIGHRLTELAVERQKHAARRPIIRESVVLGPSVREAWVAAGEDPDAKRGVLEANLDTLSIGPGQQGPRSFDPSRVGIRFRQPTDIHAVVSQPYEAAGRLPGQAAIGWIEPPNESG